MTVGEAGERQVIARVRARVPASPAFVVVGIGDDAAVLEPPRNRLDVVTTDAAVEGVHFDRRFMDAGRDRAPRARRQPQRPRRDGGRAADGAALADAAGRAAAGGAGRAARRLPGAGGPDRHPPGRRQRHAVAGAAGDRRDRVRHGQAAEGADPLGRTGRATSCSCRARWAAPRPAWPGCSRIEARTTPSDPAVADAVARFLRPEPRLRLGLLAGRTRAASAAMDLSDGLADAVRQLAEASGTGARIEAAALPVHPGVAAVARRRGRGARDGPRRRRGLRAAPRGAPAGRPALRRGRPAGPAAGHPDRRPDARRGRADAGHAGRRSADSRGFRALSGPDRRRFRARPVIAGGCARLHPGFAFRGSIRRRVAYASRVPRAAPGSQAPRGPSRPDHRPGACKTGRPLFVSPALCPGALGHDLWCCHAR